MRQRGGEAKDGIDRGVVEPRILAEVNLAYVACGLAQPPAYRYEAGAEEQ